jgi:flavoprotein
MRNKKGVALCIVGGGSRLQEPVLSLPEIKKRVSICISVFLVINFVTFYLSFG